MSNIILLCRLWGDPIIHPRTLEVCRSSIGHSEVQYAITAYGNHRLHYDTAEIEK